MIFSPLNYHDVDHYGATCDDWAQNIDTHQTEPPLSLDTTTMVSSLEGRNCNMSLSQIA